MIVKTTTDISIPPFHEMFPYTLTYMENKELKTCYFCAKEHLEKYLDRYSIDRRRITITTTEERKSKKDK